jgi:hypothetical protein
MVRIDRFDEMCGRVDESARDWPVWLGLALSLGLGRARAETPAQRQQVIDTVKSAAAPATAGHFAEAKARIAAKVRHSPNITNKEELLERLDRVRVMAFRQRSLVVMKYVYDKKTDEDIVFINTENYTEEMALGTLVHELNHFVDRHKKVIREVDVRPVLRLIPFKEYKRWFADWPMAPGTPVYKRTPRPMAIGDIFASWVYKGRKYFLDTAEIYSRVAGIKDFLVRSGFMGQEDRITEQHVIRMCEWAKGLPPEEYRKFMTNDFVPILPLIDWSREEEINLISRAGGTKKDTIA